EESGLPISVDRRPIDEGDLEPLLERVWIDAFRQAQAHDQRLVRRLAWAERLFFGDSVAVPAKSREEVFGLAVTNAAHARASSVGARADAGIIAITPVCEIVPALLSRARMIADFVGGHPGRQGHVRSHVEQA